MQRSGIEGLDERIGHDDVNGNAQTAPMRSRFLFAADTGIE